MRASLAARTGNSRHRVDTPDSESSKSVLDPVDRFSEILFGLIMAMTFTGSLNVATAGSGGVHTMLIGAIGCNLAWGFVDAVMYLLTTWAGRGRSLTLVRRVRAATAAAEARAIIGDALPAPVARNLEPAEIDHLWARMKALPTPAAHPHLGRDDLLAAVAVFFLVVASTFPVVIPFMVFEDATFATRISNVISIVMMFVAGYSLGRYAGFRPWRTGLGMVAVGSALVAMIIALGG